MRRSPRGHVTTVPSLLGLLPRLSPQSLRYSQWSGAENAKKICMLRVGTLCRKKASDIADQKRETSKRIKQTEDSPQPRAKSQKPKRETPSHFGADQTFDRPSSVLRATVFSTEFQQYPSSERQKWKIRMPKG